MGTLILDPNTGKLQTIATDIQLFGGLVSSILEVIPAAQAAGVLTGLLSVLVARALNAYGANVTTPVTPESILSLLPDQTPLVPPKP